MHARARQAIVGLAAGALLASSALAGGGPANAVVAGAGFTTNNPNADGDGSCLHGPASSTPKVNCNQYAEKEHVWINGGPSNGANALSSGTYFFAVLEPGGQPDPNDGGAKNLSDTDPAGGSGTTGGGDAYTDREFTVATSGKIATNLGTHVEDATYVTPNGLFIRLAPYDTTSNPGGVYILAICKLSSAQETSPITGTVAPSDCKYDAFKVRGDDTVVTPFGVVSGLKYYDTNANGRWDAGEPGIANWPIDYVDGISDTVYTGSDGTFSLTLVADDYTFREKAASSPWMQTGNTVDQTSVTGAGASTVTLNADKSYTVHLEDDSTVSGLNFGNVCIGAGGGLTLGFWSNKNGGRILSANGNAILNQVLALNLRKANGALLGSVNLATFQRFLLDADAVNMANMLSAQLAAMKANVANGNVSGSALVYAPGTTSANAAGFATVNALIAEANTELGLHGMTTSGSPFRAYQEALKNALDRANNNLNFLQPGPGSCPTPVFP